MLGKGPTGLIVGALLLAAAQGAVAGKKPKKERTRTLDRTPVHCIWLREIRDTRVIDDKTVLFYMYGGTIYRNTLQDKCFDLAHADAFAYHVFSTPELCRADTITPFDADIAFPPLPCRLGRFVPIDRLEAKEMLGGPKDALALQNEVQVRQIRLPPDEASSAAPGTQSAAPAGPAATSRNDAKAPESEPAPAQPEPAPAQPEPAPAQPESD